MHQVKLAIHLVVVEVITHQENNQFTAHISILKYGQFFMNLRLK
ncbi:hypothetical protein SPONN_362 [uncultured Candidatus Thioglobus sp.]|nr:hypothetical protein SPONN_362 [uncultured Candidatus Thioglobus sp.]